MSYYLELLEKLLNQDRNGEAGLTILLGAGAIYVVVEILKWLYTKHYDTIVNKEFATFKSELDDESAKKIETLKSELSTESAEKIETLKSELSTESETKITNLKIELEHKSKKEIEELRSKLENKNYITISKFDIEFKVYLEMNTIMQEVVYNMDNWIINVLCYGKNQKTIDEYIELSNSIPKFAEKINQNYFIINESVYEKADEFIEIYTDILNEVSQIKNGDKRYIQNKILKFEEIIKMNPKIYNVYKRLDDNIEELNKEIREVINRYEIIE